jgi:hypothetical protein
MISPQLFSAATCFPLLGLTNHGIRPLQDIFLVSFDFLHNPRSDTPRMAVSSAMIVNNRSLSATFSGKTRVFVPANVMAHRDGGKRMARTIQCLMCFCVKTHGGTKGGEWTIVASAECFQMSAAVNVNSKAQTHLW